MGIWAYHGFNLQYTCMCLNGVSATVCEKEPQCAPFYFTSHAHNPHFGAPGADFYSTAWDVIIPCRGLVFTAMICFQQRIGSHFFLPQRFRDLELYEKVQIVMHSCWRDLAFLYVVHVPALVFFVFLLNLLL